MVIFVDTSSLFKKYVKEAGSDDFEQVLKGASKIAISPTTWIEANNIIERRLREKRVTAEDAEWLRAEIKRDFVYIVSVVWNENLAEKAIEFLRQYPLKSLDAIQLASGVLSEAEMFVTSDRQLYTAAKKLFRKTRFI